MNDLISIIIPVYNVENYIRKCLESILAQTYFNLQIILIDDGSTDDSGRVCDEYAQKDNRIQVIHQKNQGVSSARNKGLSVAQGKYIGFCDADDWVEVDMYEYLYNLIKDTDYSVASCGAWLETEKGQKEEGIAKGDILYLDIESSLADLHICRNSNTWIWCKLFKKDTIGNITFNESMAILEDYAFECDVYEHGNGMICGTESKYHYIIRRNSATNSGYSAKYEKGVAVVKEYVDKYIKRYPSHKREFRARYILELMGLLTAMIKGNYIDRRRVREVQKILRSDIGEYIRTKHVKLHLKGSAVVICVCFPVFEFLYRKNKKFS